MKNLRSLFFTGPAKILYSILLFVLSLLIAESNVNYFLFYVEDNESFINAVTQIDSFDYQTSHYFKNTVRKTVDNVIQLSMEYQEVFEVDASVEELLNRYADIGDKRFSRIYEDLVAMHGFQFAVVNHSNRKIYSNIEQINGKNSSTNIRKYFGQYENTLLIARSCKNPYFATDTYIDFAEYIRECAKAYEDDFDLYISFGPQESFEKKAENYKELHFAMREKIEKLNNKIAIHFAVLIGLIVVALIVTGKQEPKGKTYCTTINRLPNDLLGLLYGIVLVCLSSLYRTAASMLISHGNELDEFWFTHSQKFYADRIKFCVVLFICAATNLLCIFKRQYKTGLLLKNTYIYNFILSIRKNKNPDDSES